VSDDPTETDELLEELEDAEEAAEADLEAAAEIVEEELDDLGRLAAQRDEYLGQLQRVQADFENYRKRVLKQQTEQLERAAEALVVELLPVLDAGDAGLQHGDSGVEPLMKALLDVLAKEGLERHDPAGAPFDPNLHEAVAHEPADDGGAPEVAEVLRPGYSWKGRILRPAMVRVRG